MNQSIKTFTNVIWNRIRATLEFNQPRMQAGFRKRYSTADQLHVINQVIENSAEYNKSLYTDFIDYDKAFDPVEIPGVLEAFRHRRMCDSYVNTIINTYKDSTTALLLLKKSRKIPIQKDVRKRDTISPMLFTAIFQGIFERLDWDEVGLRINSEYLSKLRFADDILLYSIDGDELQRMIEELRRDSAKVGLRI